MNRILDLIEPEHYTEQHTNASLDRLIADLKKLDNADAVFAMNLSNRISNRDREAARRLVSMTRTPPKPNPHDPYESTLDALTDCVQGGQGREAKDVADVGNAVATAFEWGFYVALACVVAWACVKGCA